ncbi:hypothetical protein ABE488_00730 [Luteimonas sp. TWI662]|uniref:hypothetical protein n=1 Tax=Luteimonas sp. TWI662 TaxID=3136789 RepID=UPI00320B126C
MSTIVLPLVLVTIDRGEEVITTKVPEHEIPILKVVHGDDAISVEDEETPEEIELDENADTEFKRLQRKYRRINAPDLVVRAFPTGPGELKHAGFKSGGRSSNATSGPAQSASRVRPPASKAKGGAKPPEKQDDEKADLQAKLEKLGVQYDGRSGVETLREQLADAEKKAKGGAK